MVRVIRAQGYRGEGEREMTHRTTFAALMAFGLSMFAAAPAMAQVDVKAYLVPVLNPGDVDPNVVLPASDDRYHLAADWNTTSVFHLEIWVNDLGAVNTGVIAAYTNITWDNGSITSPQGVHHDSAFSGFPEDAVNNFGGTDSSFQGQGLDQYVRVGYVDFDLTGPGVIDFEGSVGAGEYSVFGRSVGEIEIRGARVPEPAAGVTMALGILMALRCRRS